MKKLVIDKYWKPVELDLDEPDPMWRTHCVLCYRPLFPEWQNKSGNREIGHDAVCAICWKCSMYGPDKKLSIQTIEEQKEEKKVEQKERRKKYMKGYIPKKKRKAEIKKRLDANKPKKRPCGCGARGRHRADCPLSKEKDNGSK